MKENDYSIGTMDDLLLPDEIDTIEETPNTINLAASLYLSKPIMNKQRKNKYNLEKLLNEFNESISIVKRVSSMSNINFFNFETRTKPFILNNNNNNDLNNLQKNNLRNTINEQNKYNNIETNTETNNINEEFQPTKTFRSQSFYKKKEMTNKYSEENEKLNSNIIYDCDTWEIQYISPDIMLKKIVLEDFLKRNADNIYHFCQQCFCFLKIDIFLEKIFNCYKYYRKKNVKIEKILNIIDFLNALIIEMFDYYKIVPDDIKKEIENIYNYLITDLIKYNDYNNYNNNYFKIFHKKNIINKNLSNNKNNKNYNDNNEKNNDDFVVIEKHKEYFEENIFSEKKEFNKFLYENFFQNIFLNYSFNNENEFSILTPTENILIQLKKFLSLFNSKILNKKQLYKARKSILFYKYSKNKNILENKLISNKKIKYDIPVDTNRKYLEQGFFSIFDWKTEEIGEELIRVTNKLLSKIEPKELYRAIYLKKDKDKTSPNVIENINYSNKLTCFIIEDIISYDNTSDRAKAMEQWAKVAEYCLSQKDYNDCFAINTAFNSYIITGLKQTHKELKNKHLFKKIAKVCACNCNYKKIREEIKNLKRDECFYPFLGMMLRDINFFEESSKYLSEGKLINLEKIKNINYIMENNFKFKTEEKNDKTPIKELQFFENLENNSEDYLESLAKEIEPQFVRNKGKKKFKRITKIDEKYFMKNKKINKRFTINLKSKLFGIDN